MKSGPCEWDEKFSSQPEKSLKKKTFFKGEKQNQKEKRRARNLSTFCFSLHWRLHSAAFDDYRQVCSLGWNESRKRKKEWALHLSSSLHLFFFVRQHSFRFAIFAIVASSCFSHSSRIARGRSWFSHLTTANYVTHTLTEWHFLPSEKIEGEIKKIPFVGMKKCYANAVVV